MENVLLWWNIGIIEYSEDSTTFKRQNICAYIVYFYYSYVEMILDDFVLCVLNLFV